MRKLRTQNISWIVGCLLICASSVVAQYKVEGGAKEPILINDEDNRIQVYLVYGIENVTVSYTSASTSHQWYRYKTKALEGEKITASQQGNTSVMTDLQDGYGYGVVVGDDFYSARFIWLIDYSKYPVNIQNLRVKEDMNHCVGFQLDGTDMTPKLSYQTPYGNTTAIAREYEIEYENKIWNDPARRFDDVKIIDTLKNSPVQSSFKHLPLMDTHIIVLGDLFARHFGVEQEFNIDFLQASKIEVYADWEVLSEGTGNLSKDNNNNESSEGGKKSEYLAPAEMRFTAYANKPVASFFRWKVYSGNDTLMNYVSEEFEFTFTQARSYTVQLEVSDRSGKCVNLDHKFEFSITDTRMEVPNAFTPVGSPGINDEFKVAYQSVVSFKGWIFNRWGSELFYWNDPARGWDGKYRGKYVPAGPYFYVIEYTGTDGKKRKKSGDINVIHVKDNENSTE